MTPHLALIVAALAPCFAICQASPANSDAGKTAEGASLLTARRLSMPLPRIALAALRDTYLEGRVGHPHEAIDISAARGTPVYAVDDGSVAKVFTSAAGGLTLYQFDPEKRLAYYYAHLDRYASGVHEGMALRRCTLLGYVGATGNARPDSPHLHFAVFLLGPERHWWQGSPINPYSALKRAAMSGGSGECVS